MKTIIKILLIALFFSLIALGLISCGSRKVSNEKVKEESNTVKVDNSTIEKQSESNVKISTSTKVDDKNETVIKETTYTPEDPTKESFVIEKDGTKVVLNNTKKTYKETTQKNNTHSESIEKSDDNKKESEIGKNAITENSTIKKESKIKKTEKEQFNWLSLWWLYLIIIAIVYFIWRKFIKI